MNNTNHIKKNCIDFFHNEDIKLYVKEVMKPLVTIIYNEIYVYIWVLCIYNIFLFLIILAIFFLILNMIKNTNNKIFY
jgi:hypothetical protein